MGTKKNGHFGKKFLAPGGSYTRRERGFAAQAPRTGPTPACRSPRLPLRPRTRPLGKSIPRLIKSSIHFRARFLKKALQDMQAHSTQISSF